MRCLYPAIENVASYRIEVGGAHRLYVEECGNPDGRAVVFLHGGPGSGCNPDHRRYFDPDHYRIVLVDQRGSGRSTPPGEIHDNDTDALVRDLEVVRRQLGIDRWMLFGGSWGATLALCYAQVFPSAVSAIVLRGTFLARPRDLDWFFGDGGAARVFPEAYADFTAPVPVTERRDLVAAYHRRIHGSDSESVLAWSRHWLDWGGAVSCWTLPSTAPKTVPEAERQIAKARIETHYAINRYFVADRPLLDAVGRLPPVPVTLIHGRRDLVCPCAAAVSLHQAIPGSRLQLVEDAGHLAVEPGMIDALVGGTDRLRDLDGGAA